MRWLPRSNHDHLLELALHGPQPQQIDLEALGSRLHLQALHAADKLQQANSYQLVEPLAAALRPGLPFCFFFESRQLPETKFRPKFANSERKENSNSKTKFR